MDLPEREAVLLYGAGLYEVVRPGSYVTCAITGQRIAVNALRYWSVARQEAYATAADGLTAECGEREDG